MKNLVFILLSFSIVAHAGQDIKNPALLGEYTSVDGGVNSDLHSARLVYNNDNVLVLITDRSDTEYEVTGPDDSGIIVNYNDEPNCDGEEEHCLYDSQVLIQLSTGLNQAGQVVPQLTIDVTVHDAWDESGEAYDSQTHVLNWTGHLTDEVPYYLNVETPNDLAKIIADCKVALAQLGIDDDSEYNNYNDVCPYAQALKYRDDFETAFTAVKLAWVGKNAMDKVKLLSNEDVSTKVFNAARALTKTYKAGKSKVTAKMIKQQIDIVEAYTLAKGKQVYTSNSASRSMTLFVVDKANNSIVRFRLRVSDKW